MRHRWIPLAIGLLAAVGFTGSTSAQGQRGAFPEIDSSARGAALSGCLVALADGSDANLWNPAGLIFLAKREVSFTAADLHDLGLVRHSVAQFGWPILEKEFVKNRQGIGSRTLPPPATRAFGVAVANLNGDAGSSTYSENEFGLSFAWRLPAKTYAGATLRLLSASSSLSNVEASGSALDLGVLRPMDNFRLGFYVRNLYSSLNWKQGRDTAPPQRWHLGLAWTPAAGPVAIAGELSWLGDGDAGSRLAGGLEWRAIGPLVLRCGIRNESDSVDSRVDYSAGLGFRWSALGLDYAFLDNGYDLGTTHRWSASVGL